MLGVTMSLTKKLYCWAAFKDAKTLRIFTHEFPQVQKWWRYQQPAQLSKTDLMSKNWASWLRTKVGIPLSQEYTGGGFRRSGFNPLSLWGGSVTYDIRWDSVFVSVSLKRINCIPTATAVVSRLLLNVWRRTVFSFRLNPEWNINDRTSGARQLASQQLKSV